MSFSLDDSIALLARTPALLDGWLRGLPVGWVHSNQGPGTWSSFDIVGHLIHGEMTDWIPRAKRILAGGEEAVFEPFDRQGHEAESVGKSIDQLLDEFERCRSESLRELRTMNLGPDELELRGVHPEFGSVTLAQHLSAWTAHDLSHIAQAARAMARRYGAAVGPWHRYLPIVGSR